MILQSILFPNVETCARGAMYFKGEGVNFIAESNCYAIDKNASLSAFTYFNGFSIGKWKKYTILDNLTLRLSLSGELAIVIRHVRRINNTLKDVIIAQRSIRTNGKEDICIEAPTSNDAGIYYFVITALDENCKLYGGAYETNVDEGTLPEVKIGIDICTFRREAYVEHNMDILNKYILQNPSCDMYGKLEVFISDNSKTLDIDRLSTDLIHIFPNINSSINIIF